MADPKRTIEHAQNDLSAIGAGAAGNYSQPETTAEDKRGFLGKVTDYLMDRVFPEVGDMLAHKTAQGAAELGQALNADANSYVPYGTGQQPLEIEGPSMSFQDRIRAAADIEPPAQDRGIDV